MTGIESKVLSASLEDYLEAIYNIAAGSNIARSKDIAEVMGVAKSSVTGALKTLAQKELINYRPYGFVSLTERGFAAAEAVAKKHEVIRSFFADVLGVDGEIAHKTACEVEHALGAEIMGRLMRFVEFVSDGPQEKQIAKQFKSYCGEEQI
jgi:DtxR family Mn-dependent transcriptional regulator